MLLLVLFLFVLGMPLHSVVGTCGSPGLHRLQYGLAVSTAVAGNTSNWTDATTRPAALPTAKAICWTHQ